MFIFNLIIFGLYAEMSGERYRLLGAESLTSTNSLVLFCRIQAYPDLEPITHVRSENSVIGKRSRGRGVGERSIL